VYISPVVARQRLGKMYPSFLCWQRLSKQIPAATNACKYLEELLDASVLSVFLYIPLSLLRNNSVKTFPRQRRIVGGIVFHAVHVASRKVSDYYFP
jgi:hypothetical protein